MNTPAKKQDKKQAAPVRQAKSGAGKLLKALAAEGAFATPSDIGPDDRLEVFSRRHGVSLRTGIAAMTDAEEIVSAGLAKWKRSTASGRRSLVVTDAGLANLARGDALEGVEPFFAQHGETGLRDVEALGVTRKVAVDFGESPLARLAARRNGKGEPLLNPALFEAGEKLRRDLTIAQMVPRVTANWDPALAGGDRHGAPLTYSDIVLEARDRADAALRHVGPELSGLLIDVCGFLKGLELIEAERQWPRRSARFVLELALSALARHYGIQREARGPNRGRGVRQWGTADYRPLADPPAV